MSEASAPVPDPAAQMEYLRAQLVQSVGMPLFFGKLAQYNIVPRTVAEQQSLFNMGARLLQTYVQKQAELAQTDGSFLLLAERKLAEALGEPAAAPQPDLQIAKQAAAQLLGDPQIAQAALLYTALANNG